MSILPRILQAGRAIVPLLGVCACTVGPAYRPPALDAPARFEAPLPPPPSHPANNSGDVWRSFNDQALSLFVDRAIAGNPGLAQAAARIAEARAVLGAARGARWPEVDADGSVQRSSSVIVPGETYVYTAISRSLDASWELDFFGARRQDAKAAAERVGAREADLAAAQVALAAEVATDVVHYRACRALASVQRDDLNSSATIAHLTHLKTAAGFSSHGDEALSEASAANVRLAVSAQESDCELDIKALVSLTGLAERDLRGDLGDSQELPRIPGIAVARVPADALSQRPDISSAERDLEAAGAAIQVAEAQRYPRITLLGSIGVAGSDYAGQLINSPTWSFGPSLSLPLFDGGRSRANVDAAVARYDQAQAAYRQTVRMAVREIEENLVRLDVAGRREGDAAEAVAAYARYFGNTSDRFQAGHGSLFELEEARRNLHAARLALIGLQRDRLFAWIGLYKAMGGGWTRPES